MQRHLTGFKPVEVDRRQPEKGKARAELRINKRFGRVARTPPGFLAVDSATLSMIAVQTANIPDISAFEHHFSACADVMIG